MNSVTISGYIGNVRPMRKVGVKQTSVIEASMSVDRWNKDEKPCYMDIQAWGGTADFLVNVEHFEKGQRYAVIGELRMDEWEKDGQKKRRHYIFVREIKRIQVTARAEGAASVTDAAPKTDVLTEESDPVDLPF